jgi:hypothetical protein
MPKTVELDIPKDAAERELVRLTSENARLRAALVRIAQRNDVYQGETYKIAREALDAK